jgi:HEAT repeat protein
MTRARAGVVTAAAALLAVGVAALLLSRRPAPFAFAWPAGNVYTYRVSLRVDGGFTLAGAGQAPLEAVLALDGELVLRSYGTVGSGGDTVLGVRLARLSRLDWRLGPQPVLSDDGRSLVGPEVVLVAASDGTFRSLNVQDGGAPTAENLLRQLLAPLEVVVASGERTWSRQQRNPLGELRADYTVRRAASGRLGLRREPVRYTHLAAAAVIGDVSADASGAFAIVLDRAGYLQRVQGEEKVAVAGSDGAEALRQETRIEAELLSITRAEPGPAAVRRLEGLSATGLGDVSTSAEADRRLLEQRIGDLTMERLVEDLFIHGPAPDFPDAGPWMWRATGLLLLHPERCRDLIEVFESPGMTQRARARVLDLLAATGSPEAQAVVRELLESPAAKGSERYELLLQRLSLVEQPTPETVDWLRAKVEEKDGAFTLAAAHALGAAIGKRSRAPGGEVDERAAGLLRDGLAAARSVQDRTDWLGALGNAGLAEDVPLVSRFAADGDPAVRAAAASALRKSQTPAAEGVLLGLAADPDAVVQDRALHTLASYSLGPTGLDALREQVSAGRLVPRSYAMLATLLENHRALPDAVLPVLDAMLAGDIADPRLVLRLRDLRARLVAAGVPDILTR